MLTLDHVQLAAPAGCEDAARAFFVGLLGLEEKPKPASMQASGGVWFVAGMLELHVGVQANFRPAKKAHVGLRAGNVPVLEALAVRLEAAGHAPRWDARLPGFKRFFVDDPWGNRLEVLAAEGQ